MLRFPQLRWLAILTAGLWFVAAFPLAAAQNTAPEQMPATNGSYRIAGTVVSATGGQPLSGARVLIAETKNRRNIQSLITSEDGRFAFQVTRGKYSLQGAKRGFITSAYDQHDQFSTAIATGPDLASENLILRLAPAAVIAGKIFDESGDPVRHASVSLYRQDRFSGISRTHLFRRSTTDDQGAYEMTPLDGGTYFLSVSAKPWYAIHPHSSQPGSGTPASSVDHSLDVAYPVTYYADATEADDATPIPVKGGDHIEVDVHLNPVPALHLVFHAADDGRNGFTVPRLEKPGFDGTEFIHSNEIQSISPGVYEMTGLAAGRYAVRMPGFGGDLKEPATFDLTRDGQELETPTVDPTGSVKATVQLLGQASLPSELSIQLRGAKERFSPVAEVNANGEADFQSVIAGEYDVLAGTPSRRYAVVRVVSQNRDTAGHVLQVPPGSSLTVSLTLVEGAVTLEGFAKRSGKPVAGAMVVLVPKDPEGNHDLFRRDQSDSDGSFSLQGVIPGSYTVIAIESAWDLDWAKPAVLAHYGKHGQSVVIGNESKGPKTLSESVEVQSK